MKKSDASETSALLERPYCELGDPEKECLLALLARAGKYLSDINREKISVLLEKPRQELSHKESALLDGLYSAVSIYVTTISGSKTQICHSADDAAA